MTKPASAAAAFSAPSPSLFADSGTLAQNLVRSLPRRPRRDRAPCRALEPGRPADPVDAGRQPGEMAPRPHHLVLRAIPARRALRGLQALPPRLRLSCSIPIMSAPVPRHARHQRGHLTRPGADEVTAYRRHVDAAIVKFFQTPIEDTLASAGAAGRGRPQSRAAASGIDADRHPARLRAESDPAGLRSGVALSGLDPRRRRVGHAQRGHPHRRACRRQLSFRQ